MLEGNKCYGIKEKETWRRRRNQFCYSSLTSNREGGGGVEEERKATRAGISCDGNASGRKRAESRRA